MGHAAPPPPSVPVVGTGRSVWYPPAPLHLSALSAVDLLRAPHLGAVTIDGDGVYRRITLVGPVGAGAEGRPTVCLLDAGELDRPTPRGSLNAFARFGVSSGRDGRGFTGCSALPGGRGAVNPSTLGFSCEWSTSDGIAAG